MPGIVLIISIRSRRFKGKIMLMSILWDVLGIGNAAVDDLVYLPHFPLPDTKLTVQSMLRQGGGLTATALVAAARQGARVAYCCALGLDDLSDYTLAELVREGVDVSPVQRVAGARPYQSVILVDTSTGQRTILKQPGQMQPDLSVITPELVTRARVLLVDHLLPQAVLAAAQIARAHGIPVVADVESSAFAEENSLMPLIDHLIISIGVAQRLTGLNDPGAMLRSLSHPQRACLAITAGEDGVYYCIAGGAVTHIPALRVQAVDTTGCGDVFHGAYAAALARGETIQQAIAIANVTAGRKATQPGGRLGIPSLETAKRFLEST